MIKTVKIQVLIVAIHCLDVLVTDIYYIKIYNFGKSPNWEWGKVGHHYLSPSYITGTTPLSNAMPPFTTRTHPSLSNATYTTMPHIYRIPTKHPTMY